MQVESGHAEQRTQADASIDRRRSVMRRGRMGDAGLLPSNSQAGGDGQPVLERKVSPKSRRSAAGREAATPRRTNGPVSGEASSARPVAAEAAKNGNVQLSGGGQVAAENWSSSVKNDALERTVRGGKFLPEPESSGAAERLEAGSSSVESGDRPLNLSPARARIEKTSGTAPRIDSVPQTGRDRRAGQAVRASAHVDPVSVSADARDQVARRFSATRPPVPEMQAGQSTAREMPVSKTPASEMPVKKAPVEKVPARSSRQEMVELAPPVRGRELQVGARGKSNAEAPRTAQRSTVQIGKIEVQVVSPPAPSFHPAPPPPKARLARGYALWPST